MKLETNHGKRKEKKTYYRETKEHATKKTMDDHYTTTDVIDSSE